MCITNALTWRNTAYRIQLDAECDMFIHSKYQFINVFAYVCLADFPGSEYWARQGDRYMAKWRNCDLRVIGPPLFLGN